MAHTVSALCLSPLKPSLVCGTSCDRVPAVFSGYFGFPPFHNQRKNSTIEGHKSISIHNTVILHPHEIKLPTEPAVDHWYSRFNVIILLKRSCNASKTSFRIWTKLYNHLNTQSLELLFFSLSLRITSSFSMLFCAKLHVHSNGVFYKSFKIINIIFIGYYGFRS